MRWSLRSACLVGAMVLLLLLGACSEKEDLDSKNGESSQSAAVSALTASPNAISPGLPTRQDSDRDSGSVPLRPVETTAPVSGKSPSVESLADDSVPFLGPQGLYSVPIPTGWSIHENKDFISLTDPSGRMTVHIAVIESEDSLGSVAQVWDLAEPGLKPEVSRVTDPPPSLVGGVDEYKVVDYQWDPESTQIYQAESRRVGDNVYALLYSMNLEAFQQRASQLWIISTGFEIEELPKEDLSTQQPVHFDGEIADQFESFIVETMELFDAPGTAVAVVQDGEIVYANGFGVQAKGGEEPVTPETMMLIGSTGKSLTTLLMAQLVEEGVFSWNTRVVDIFPDFRVADPEITNQITMQDMVCACSGVPRRDLEWMFNSFNLTAEEVIESLADFEFFTEFGEVFQYSNQMVAAGGYLAALAAGGEYGTLREDYITLIEERVFNPIGMEDTTFSFEEVIERDHFARPHGQNLVGDIVEIPLSYEFSLVPVAPAGALWSNVLDMADYLVTLLNKGMTSNGEQLVSPTGLAALWEPQVQISSDSDYGLGWMIEDYHGLQIVNHAGNTFGYSSEFAFAPSANLGVAVLSNQFGSQLTPRVREWIFERLYQRGAETEEVVSFINQRAAQENAVTRHRLRNAIDNSLIEPYLGWYSEEALGDAMLSWQGDDLILDVGEYQIEIRAFLGNDDIEYATYSPPLIGLPVKFELDDLGNPMIVLGTGVVEYHFLQTLNPSEMVPGS